MSKVILAAALPAATLPAATLLAATILAQKDLPCRFQAVQASEKACNNLMLVCLQNTFEVHWGKHHRTYVNNLNNQIQGKDLESKSLEEVSAAGH